MYKEYHVHYLPPFLPKTGKECKSTWKEDELMYLEWEGCTSTEEYKLKFCSTCKKHKCCGPGRTKTVDIDFECKDKNTPIVTHKFMWIKNCECYMKRRCPFTYK